MIDCAFVTERLDDLVDGMLDAPTRRDVEAHLTSCLACRSEAEALERLLRDTRGLPRRIEPPPRLWAAIDRDLDARAARGRRLVAFRPAVLAAAAAVLVLLTATVTAVAVRRSAEPSVVAQRSGGGTTDEVEAELIAAVRELERALDERRADLRPDALAVIEQSLAVIDAAIVEARGALAQDRSNTVLAGLLWNSYRTKVDLLMRATRL